eukprot:TRINITY_DN17198_c0_g3_i1.p8 TRINITY_DN17198_c0_g3~~TRINITY_DN17198_c0_g3_i1.p8  ORF type:complete len:102 (+),score=1.11 TRINITY_DN17198_c0_g3_i1:1277-1582(+)
MRDMFNNQMSKKTTGIICSQIIQTTKSNVLINKLLRTVLKEEKLRTNVANAKNKRQTLLIYTKRHPQRVLVYRCAYITLEMFDGFERSLLVGQPQIQCNQN